ncbi:MAG: hypothetical protein ACXAC2_20365 [Candidatus Kariarchaeaceae archaeon]
MENDFKYGFIDEDTAVFEKKDIGSLHAVKQDNGVVKIWVLTLINAHQLAGCVDYSKKLLEIWKDHLGVRVIAFAVHYCGVTPDWEVKSMTAGSEYEFTIPAKEVK